MSSSDGAALSAAPAEAEAAREVKPTIAVAVRDRKFIVRVIDLAFVRAVPYYNYKPPPLSII